MTTNLPWRVEQACLHAFPALREVKLDDWLLRFSEGLSRRANSVNPLSPACGNADVGGIAAAVEGFYGAEALPTIFRVPSLIGPALDRGLAARGYSREGESLVMHGPIGAVNGAADSAVQLLPRPDAAWLAAMSAMQGHSALQRVIYRRITGPIALPARFAMLSVDGKPAALAYGALHDGLLCYESVITDARRRRQGLARRVVAGLAAWGRDQGGTGVCLQVEAGNAPGRALYAGIGMAELYRYHYRREPRRFDEAATLI